MVISYLQWPVSHRTFLWAVYKILMKWRYSKMAAKLRTGNRNGVAWCCFHFDINSNWSKVHHAVYVVSFWFKTNGLWATLASLATKVVKDISCHITTSNHSFKSDNVLIQRGSVTGNECALTVTGSALWVE